MEVDGNLLYQTHWLELKFDATESVYSIKMIVIRYLAHLRAAQFVQCGVPNFNSISMKVGLYLLEHLLFQHIDQNKNPTLPKASIKWKWSEANFH